MPQISITRRDGSNAIVDARANMTLMEVLRDESIDIEALCGGCCSCATCHVYIAPKFADRLPPISADEEVLLEESASYRRGESRLSCQIRVSDRMEGFELAIAPSE